MSLEESDGSEHAEMPELVAVPILLELFRKTAEDLENMDEEKRILEQGSFYNTMLTPELLPGLNGNGKISDLCTLFHFTQMRFNR